MRLGGPREVFAEVARFIRSDAVQEIWAPAFGASEELTVPDLAAWVAPTDAAADAPAEGLPAKKAPPRPMPARRPIQTE